MHKMLKMRIILLIVVVVILLGGVLMVSMTLLPAPPTSPTATYPKGIDFPDGRPVPRR